MLRVLATLTLIACLQLSYAFSWVYAPSKQENSNGAPELEFRNVDGGLPPGEVAAILLGSRSLDGYSKKPDCFRRTASVLQTKCGDLETDEYQRVKAAISMTLCEIATAEPASPPLECKPFQQDSNGLYALDPESGRRCVSALSRSAQYWSSYSGYLREVTQLCFAFQRWNDIDTAKEVHRNTTMEAMNVLRYLSDREKRVAQSYEDTKSIVALVQTVLEQVVASSKAIDLAAVAASDKLKQFLDEVSERFSAAVLEIEQRTIHDHTRTMSWVDANISQTLDRFSTATHSMVADLGRTLSFHVGSTVTQLESGLGNLGLLVDGTSSKFAALENAFGELHHATVLLVMDARQAGADMEEHLKASNMALEKQRAIATISDNVSFALSELVVRAQAGMQDLNGTIAEIKDSLLNNRHDDWTTATWLWFQEVILDVLRVHPASFQHPVFHAVYHIFRIGRALAVFFSSGLMSCFVLLASAGNLLSRYLRGRGPCSDQSMFSVLPEAPRARTRICGPPAMEGRSLDWNVSQSGHAFGLPLDLRYGPPVPRTSLRRHPRLSRIPERLWGPH